MKYRHSFHAGNFADVHKHVTLLALLGALQRKDKGLLYFETHAGRGLYDLGGADSPASHEARAGIGLLRAAHSETPELVALLAAVKRACGSGAQLYPGSPLLAAQLLRTQDRALCCEILPPECRALERALHDYPRMRCLCADGFAALSAHLPPVERRALVLIDPPYEESGADLQRGLDAISVILARLANAVIALWYPIKDARELVPWMQRVATLLRAPTLKAQLWVHPTDSRVALNGSGLLLVNPPYEFDTRMQVWLPELATVLSGGGAAGSASGHGGSSIDWILHGH
jgi:23S rRNA (adenine2030-N6)-methyltransferase